MFITIDKLSSLVRKALRHYGYAGKELKTIAEVLLYAELRGNNQGISKLVGKGIPNQATDKILLERETKLSALVNGNMHFGIAVLQRAMQVAVKKAKRHGISIVGTYNSASSSGAIGYFAREMAKQDLVALVFAGSPPTVAPFGSIEKIFGTNPLAVGIPAKEQPLVLDFATAAIAWYGLIQAEASGKNIPNNVAYDSEGTPTTDPKEAQKGAIRPFDRNYKGSGLALIIEILTGPLIGAGFIDHDAQTNWGNLIIAFEPALFGTIMAYKDLVDQLLQRVKQAKLHPNMTEILLPGERGDAREKIARETGGIDIDKAMIQQLRAIGL